MSHPGPKKKYQLYGRGSSSSSKPSGLEQESESNYGGSTSGISPSSSLSNLSVASPGSVSSYGESFMGMSPRSSTSQECDSLYGGSSMGMSPINRHSLSVNSSGYISPYDYSPSSSLQFPSPFSPALYGAGAYPDIPSTDVPEQFRKAFSSGAGPSSHLPLDRHKEHRNQNPPTVIIDDDDEESRQTGTKQKEKRTQKCRMCANHDRIVDVKGHKWHCPFRNCTCSDCDVTRKCQIYMKERQKLTRQQQQQLLSGTETVFEGQRGIAEPPKISSNQTQDFPRVNEMVNDIEHILDDDILEKANMLCRPKSSNRRH